MSHLTFYLHEPPIRETELCGRDCEVHRYMTVKWKGLDFLRVVQFEWSGWMALGSARSCPEPDLDEDEDDENNEVKKSHTDTATTKKSEEFTVHSLMPEFLYSWGNVPSLYQVKPLAEKAERMLVAFAYKIQTRRAI